jgi:hypothetical protein
MNNTSKIWEYESNEEDKLSKQVYKDPDIVMTNPDMAKSLIKFIGLKEGDEVMEPCYGKGAFFDNLPTFTNNFYCEKNMGIDYLTQDRIVDVTLSNPPFVPRKLFWDFHVKAMDTTRREIWWLINILSLNVFTPKRLEEMKSKGWGLESMHIVADKRWYGRYAWCKFGKTHSILTFDKRVY